ncbi:MAG: alkaline phosphatase family protein [Deltaproteobacteria bacterium]|nr:alkaline phosphatase family protein [Deltaproteobacteria bacterium]
MRACLWLSLALGAVGACRTPRPEAVTSAAPLPAPPPPPPRPSDPLVVTLVIDQFAAWTAAERLPLLPPDGGFARLRREGTWYRQLRYAHAATDTAPGHSSLYTARPPRDSGILANELPDGRGGRVSILRDEAVRVVTFEGVTETAGSSIARLRVPTLADRLREARPDAVIVSVSLKDRGAIFGGGRRPDATLWFDPGRDSFVTSTGFSQALPPWAREHGAPDAVRALRSTPWTLLDEAFVRAHARGPDAQPGEGDLDGWGTTFPHDFTRARRPGGALRASPRGDLAVLSLAGDAVEHARVRGRPMLLAVSLSSNDYIGHVFGPDSWEAWDQLRHLDRALGSFFQRLDSLVGEGGWSVVLSADHGIVGMPELAGGASPWCGDGGRDPWERPCGAGGRLDPDEVGRSLQAAAVAALGPGEWVLGVADPYVYVTPAAEALAPERRERLQAALRDRARAYVDVERVVDARTVPDRCAEDETPEALLCRSIPARSGAVLYLQARAGVFFDAGYTLGQGTSHGSPYLFDRAVPLLVRDPGREPAGRVVEEPQPFTRYRALAERFLGIEP